jgi:hypothetical protein
MPPISGKASGPQYVRFDVLGRYPIRIRVEDLAEVFRPLFEGSPPGVERRSYLHFMRSPSTMNDVLLELCAAESLLSTVAVELYGGMGLASAVIDRYLRPRRHVVFEIDRACHRILKDQGREAYLGDAFDLVKRFGGADLYYMDHNTCTMMKSPAGLEEAKPAMDSARFWFCLDTAGSKFHLNRRAYERVCGRQLPDYRRYLEQLNRMSFLPRGRSITHVRYFRNGDGPPTGEKHAADKR